MSSISIPVLHIIFYLASLFMPAGTTGFAASYAEHTVEWTLQDDGWHGSVNREHDIGVWSVDGLVVSVIQQGDATETDLSPFIQQHETSEDAPQADTARILVDERPVSLSWHDSTLTVSQDEDGAFSQPVVINYSSK